MALGSGIIPAWLFIRMEDTVPCVNCKHHWAAHREPKSCLGVVNPAKNAVTYYKGNCKKRCKRYIKDNLEYLRWKHDQKKKRK